MRVYVITKGCYSDYHICCVATDEDTAEKLRALYTDNRDEASIEEFDTSEPLEYLAGRLPFDVYFSREGAVRAHNRIDWDDFQNNTIRVFEPRSIAAAVMVVSVVAADEGQAIKIAIDKRAQYLAEKAGV